MCEPVVNALMAQAAALGPANLVLVIGTAAQTVVPPSRKSTVPVGAEPLTSAVKTTGFPAIEGLAEEDKAVVETGPTTCEIATAVLGRLVSSPE